MRILLLLLTGSLCWAQLEFLGFSADGVGGVSGIGGAEFVAVAPDGGHVYVTGASVNGLAVFDRLASGTLSFVESHIDGSAGVDGLLGAQGITISGDDLDVYVTGSAEDKVSHFRRDPSTGMLSFAFAYENGFGGISAMAGPVRVTLDPSGSHLYVGCITSSSVVIFERDALSGDLTFVGSVSDNATNGLAGAAGVALNGTGTHLYVSGSGEDAVTLFERDPVTGLLTFLEVYRNGSGGVAGIAGTNDLVVSGRFLYVTGFADSAVAMFRRDPATGLLSFIEAEYDGVGSVDGLSGAIGVAVSPNGKQVLVSGFNDNSVAVFERILGTLTFRQVLTDGSGGVDGLQGSVSPTFSADGKHAYVTGFTDGAVAQFETVASLGTLYETWATSVSITDLAAYVSMYP